MALRVAIPGGTGLIGTRLVESLVEHGHLPVILTRSPDRARHRFAGIDIRRWSLADSDDSCSAFEDADAIVNLSGDPIDAGRWNKERKQRIRDSRVVGTRSVVRCLTRLKQRPDLLVAGSAVGYYGSRGDTRLDEKTGAGDGFLANVCEALEREAEEAGELGLRVIRLRTGVVLSPDGGALQRMARPFRFGLGGRLGDGMQWFSWIHITDLVEAIVHSIETREISGAVNAVAPGPVTNEEFTRVLGDVLDRPAVLRIPGQALRLALGELADALLSSQRAVPDRLTRAGFRFAFPDLREALVDCLQTRKSA